MPNTLTRDIGNWVMSQGKRGPPIPERVVCVKGLVLEFLGVDVGLSFARRGRVPFRERPRPQGGMRCRSGSTRKIAALPKNDAPGSGLKSAEPPVRLRVRPLENVLAERAHRD